MDYTIDACKNIHTQGQTDRMRAVFAQGGPRAAFINNYFRLNPPTQNPLCGTSTTITAANPLCLPVAWSITDPATINGNGNIATINRTGTGIVNVTATAGGYTDTGEMIIGNPTPLISFDNEDPLCINMRFPTGVKYGTIFNVNAAWNWYA